ncbi:hypothetical protein EV715DRAFT_258335 [Schizophyllum commune]
MRFSSVFLVALATTASASWWSSEEPEYNKWSTKQLKQYLEESNVALPTGTLTEAELRERVKANWHGAQAWTYDQYNSAQQAFANVRDTTFDTWDESRLREWLAEQGVVEAKGPREKLVLLAKQRYQSYTNAASSYASQASSAGYDASASVASFAAQATNDVARAVDDTKDYVYSTWDDTRLKAYLVENGYMKSNEQKRRDELLGMMRDAYAKVTNPIWEAWTDSYIHEWLTTHRILPSTDSIPSRQELADKMQLYYYDTKDNVYSTWSDSELKNWLIAHGVIKSDAQASRDKLLKMVQDNYATAQDTVWSSWSDSDLRSYLIEHGYLKSDEQKKREELVNLISSKYNDITTTAASYLTWPDARLRAYLREHGVDDTKIRGMDRTSLLQETRIRYVQGKTRSDALWEKVRSIVNGAVGSAEDGLARVVEVVQGNAAKARAEADATTVKGKAEAASASVRAKASASSASAKAKAKTEL